ncbi:MAG: Ig-like domain-containing protein [Gemmatimonadota bacterium]
MTSRGRRVTSRGRRAAALLLAAGCVAAYAAACASPGSPPGGPVDHAAPVILKVTPDSGATGVRSKGVTVAFNEVVSERPRAGTDLGAVVLLSPSDGAARVDWHRDAITVRPRKGFRANTAYALTVLPGLSDLRSNAITSPRTFVFSTGASIPRGVVRGAVFDWTTVKPAGLALIDATVGGDTSFRWIAKTDSSGRYALPFLPSDKYTLRTIIDANQNGRLDPRELWDSVTVVVADSLRLDLYAFMHDTLGARIVGVDVKDSLTLRLVFDRALALDSALSPGQVELRRADSSRVRVRSLVRASAFDSVARAREVAVRDSTLRADTTVAGRRGRARADSGRVIAQQDSIENARVEARRAERDTVKRVPPPVPARMAITPEFVAELDEPIGPGAYRLTVRNALSASRVRRTSERTFSRAKPVEKPPESKADSTVKKPPGVSAPATKPPVKPPRQ